MYNIHRLSPELHIFVRGSDFSTQSVENQRNYLQKKISKDHIYEVPYFWDACVAYCQNMGKIPKRSLSDFEGTRFIVDTAIEIYRANPWFITPHILQTRVDINLHQVTDWKQWFLEYQGQKRLEFSMSCLEYANYAICPISRESAQEELCGTDVGVTQNLDGAVPLWLILSCGGVIPPCPESMMMPIQPKDLAMIGDTVYAPIVYDYYKDVPPNPVLLDHYVYAFSDKTLHRGWDVHSTSIDSFLLKNNGFAFLAERQYPSFFKANEPQLAFFSPLYWEVLASRPLKMQRHYELLTSNYLFRIFNNRDYDPLVINEDTDYTRLEWGVTCLNECLRWLCSPDKNISMGTLLVIRNTLERVADTFNIFMNTWIHHHAKTTRSVENIEKLQNYQQKINDSANRICIVLDDMRSRERNERENGDELLTIF